MTIVSKVQVELQELMYKMVLKAIFVQSVQTTVILKIMLILGMAAATPTPFCATIKAPNTCAYEQCVANWDYKSNNRMNSAMLTTIASLLIQLDRHVLLRAGQPFVHQHYVAPKPL
jgi:hypothetical protein